MDYAVFNEKVRCPEPRGLVRERLERQLLDSGSAQTALILGPPGSGKTTLLSQVARAAGLPTGWYRAAAEDDHELALVRHLAYTLGAALNTDSLLGITTIDALVSSLEALGEPSGHLILDDVQAVAGTGAEHALERFISLRPRSLRIVLGSRRPPLMNTSRLLANGELCQIDGDDLRFRSWEVEELFRVIYQQPLSPESAAALTRRTGGWAAGLHLFQLATATMPRHERERAVAELNGRSRLIRSYLARNVLDGLDERRLDFLLRSSTLGILTGELCDQLLKTEGSAVVLDELEQHQFFTSSTDGGQTFRYHQVLQTHLEVVLIDQIGGRAARELYRRAAQLLEADERAGAAIRAYARAEDWGDVGRLLRRGSPSLPVEDEWLWSVLGPPGAPADDPALVVAGARRLLRNGLVTEAEAAYRHAATLMDDPEFQSRCAHERAVAAMWLPTAPGLDQAHACAGPRGLKVMAEIRSVTRSVGPAAAGTFPISRGLSRLLVGDAAGASLALRAVLHDRQSAEWEVVVAQMALHLITSQRSPDGSGPDRPEEIVAAAEQAGYPWLAQMARGLHAALSLASSGQDWEIAACGDLIDDAERHGELWSICLLSGMIGTAHVVAGHTDHALSALIRCVETASELRAPVIQVWAESLRQLVCANGHPSTEDVARLAAWADSFGATGVGRLLTDPGSLKTLLPQIEWAERQSAPSRTEVEQPPAIRLACLGGFALTVGDRAIDMGAMRPKARVLLYVLALHQGQPVHRELLIDAVWPEASQISGTRSLQVAVSSIRGQLLVAGLPQQGLRRQGDGYALNLPGVSDQLRNFEQLVADGRRLEAEGRLAESLRARVEALEAYAGELLPEVGPAEWVLAERERVKLLAVGVGTDCARLALVLGELEQGARAARRSVQIEPYQDTTWQLLADLLDRGGDHTAAALARREHAQIQAAIGLPVTVIRSRRPAPGASHVRV